MVISRLFLHLWMFTKDRIPTNILTKKIRISLLGAEISVKFFKIFWKIFVHILFLASSHVQPICLLLFIPHTHTQNGDIYIITNWFQIIYMTNRMYFPLHWWLDRSEWSSFCSATWFFVTATECKIFDSILFFSNIFTKMWTPLA